MLPALNSPDASSPVPAETKTPCRLPAGTVQHTNADAATDGNDRGGSDHVGATTCTIAEAEAVPDVKHVQVPKDAESEQDDHHPEATSCSFAFFR